MKVHIEAAIQEVFGLEQPHIQEHWFDVLTAVVRDRQDGFRRPITPYRPEVRSALASFRKFRDAKPKGTNL